MSKQGKGQKTNEDTEVSQFMKFLIEERRVREAEAEKRAQQQAEERERREQQQAEERERGENSSMPKQQLSEKGSTIGR